MPGTSLGMTTGRERSAGERPPRPTSSPPIGAQLAPKIRTGHQWNKSGHDGGGNQGETGDGGGETPVRPAYPASASAASLSAIGGGAQPASMPRSASSTWAAL